MSEQASESMWIVDKYCDRITARPKKQVLREAEHQWYHSRVTNRFDTLSEAVNYTIARAEGCVAGLERDLKKARDRVKRLKRKYGVAA